MIDGHAPNNIRGIAVLQNRERYRPDQTLKGLKMHSMRFPILRHTELGGDPVAIAPGSVPEVHTAG